MALKLAGFLCLTIAFAAAINARQYTLIDAPTCTGYIPDTIIPKVGETLWTSGIYVECQGLMTPFGPKVPAAVYVAPSAIEVIPSPPEGTQYVGRADELAYTLFFFMKQLP